MLHLFLQFSDIRHDLSLPSKNRLRSSLILDKASYCSFPSESKNRRQRLGVAQVFDRPGKVHRSFWGGDLLRNSWIGHVDAVNHNWTKPVRFAHNQCYPGRSENNCSRERHWEHLEHVWGVSHKSWHYQPTTPRCRKLYWKRSAFLRVQLPNPRAGPDSGWS